MVSPSVSRRFGGLRREVRASLELFALNGIAFVQPLLGQVRQNSADVFVATGASRVQVAAFVTIILFGPPVIIWVVEVAVGLVWPGGRRFAHAAFAGAIVGLIAAEILTHQTDLGRPEKLVVAIPVAIGAAFLILRIDPVRMFLRYLSIAPVVFAILLLLNAQVNPVILSARVGTGVDVRIARPDRVVMIVMDEFPLISLLDGTGHVDAGPFPNFAELAAGSTWYRNDTTVAPYTSAAVPALLTGNYPTDPRALATASVYPHNLFTLLGNSYGINAHENLEGLNPSGDTEGPASLDFMVRKSIAFWQYWAWPPASDLNAVFRQKINWETVNDQLPAGRRFVESLKPSKGKQLDYLHLLIPHLPWHVLSDGRSYTDLVTQPGLAEVWDDAVLAKVARQRYLLQLQAADRLVGQIVAKLHKIGAYDKSLIILTADNGEGFVPKNPARKATQANYPEVMWAPLFIKTPGQTVGKIDDRPAHSIDVLPTIADVLGAKLPWKIDGRSLLDSPRPDGMRRLLEMPSGILTELSATANYENWNGPQGFARVMASRAAAPGDDQALRIYKGTSSFGDLVGRPAAPLVDPSAPSLSSALSEPEIFRNVDPRARKVPWAYVQGSVNGQRA